MTSAALVLLASTVLEVSLGPRCDRIGPVALSNDAGVAVASNEQRTVLTVNGAVLWSHAGAVGAVRLDASTLAVALKDRLVLISLPQGTARDVDVLKVLTRAERDVFQWRRCPSPYLQGLRFDEDGLVVGISRLREGLSPMHPTPEPLELFVPLDGGTPRRLEVSRSQDPAELARLYREANTRIERGYALSGLCSRVDRFADAGQTELLVSLLDSATGDPMSDTGNIAWATRELPPAHGLRLLRTLLDRKDDSGDEAVVAALKVIATAEARTLAGEIALDGTRREDVRTEALRVATDEGRLPDDALWGRALADRNAAVRYYAAEDLRRAKRCSPALFERLLQLEGHDDLDAPFVPGDFYAHLLSGCVCAAQSPEHLERLQRAVKEGRTLWAQAYLDLAFFSNSRGNGTAADRLLDMGAPLATVNEVRAFQAMRAQLALDRADAAAARAAFSALRAGKDSRMVCAAEPKDLKSFASECACTPRMFHDKFVEHFDPPRGR